MLILSWLVYLCVVGINDFLLIDKRVASMRIVYRTNVGLLIDARYFLLEEIR